MIDPTEVIATAEKDRPDLADTVVTPYTFPAGTAFHFEFPTSYSMNMTMVRFQEFYESAHPSIQGRRFSLEQYMDIYARTEHKEWYGLGLLGWWLRRRNPTVKGFDYLTRVLGTNVPGYAMSDFIDLHVKEETLRDREAWMEAVLKQKLGVDDITTIYADVGPGSPVWERPFFYVIGTYKGDRDAKGTLAHELAHARFYLDDEYRTAATILVMKNWSPALEKALRARGYAPDTDIDEMHAFALTGWAEWFPWHKRDKMARNLRRALRKEFLKT